MFEITINIPGLPELAAAIKGITPATNATSASEPAPAPVKAAKTAPAKAKEATPAPAPAAVEKPAAVVEDAPAPAKPSGPSADDLLAAAKDKLRSLVAENEGNVDFKAKLRDCVKEHGAKNISTLPDLDSVKAVETALEDYIASL